MKKITALFFLFIFIITIINNNDNNTIMVNANIPNKNNYQKLYLKFEDNSLTTKNFKIYFNNEMHIISLFTVFDNCQINNNRYMFKSNGIDNNLEDYYHYYSQHFINDTKDYFEGVPIYIVEVDLNDRQLQKILSKNKDIVYSEKLCGNYQ